VMINTNFLTTLDPLEIYSGIGESFKLHLIGGAKTTALFEELLPACLQENHDTLKQLIFNSLAIKKAVIEYDEFEVNVRKALNYGHSFGHAIESLSNYAIPHGIAVTLGILIENEISRQLGYLDSDLSERITRLALRFIPSSSLKTLCSLNFDNLLHLLKMDKKTKGIQLKLTCLKDLGNMCFNNITLDTTNERRLNETCVTVSDTLLQHSLKEKS
jgi:3-dehydroquinate synthase